MPKSGGRDAARLRPDRPPAHFDNARSPWYDVVVENQVTALDITTLVIAVVGATTGIASLGWTVASHVLTGARVKVELVVGWVANGSVVTLPWSSHDPSKPPLLTGIDFQYSVVGVQVRNIGRLACSVRGWSVSLDNGVALGHVELPMNSALPHRLDAGEERTWFANLAHVVAMIEASRGSNMPPRTVFASSSLGDGRTIKSSKHPVPT